MTTNSPTPDPYISINIDGENDDLSNDPFYGDKAIGMTPKRSKE